MTEEPSRKPRFDPEVARALRCPSCGAPAAEGATSCEHCEAPLATRRCLRCFELCAGTAERCGRCGALLPTEVLAAPPAGSCPDCRLPLVSRAFGAVGYAECARCGGLFLSKHAFDVVARDADTRSRVRLEKPGAAAAPLSTVRSPVRYRPCPVCKKLMNRMNYAGGSGIVIDSCGEHGAFFDHGELTAIVDFLEGGGWERVQKRERERLSEEVRSLQHSKEIHASLDLPADAGERSFQGFELLGRIVSFVAGLFGSRW